jgi:hypothetical protein
VTIDHVLHGSVFGIVAREVFELPGSDHGGVRVELVAYALPSAADTGTLRIYPPHR